MLLPPDFTDFAEYTLVALEVGLVEHSTDEEAVNSLGRVNEGVNHSFWCPNGT